MSDDVTPATEAGRPPGYTVWRAWRDGMLAQGREVAPERMEWETLDQRDRDLDAAIEAQALRGAAERVRALRDHAQRQGTWGIEYGDDRFMDAALAAIQAALDGAPEAAGGGLDVERLARAVEAWLDCGPHRSEGDHDHRKDAVALAAEYARLAADKEGPAL